MGERRRHLYRHRGFRSRSRARVVWAAAAVVLVAGGVLVGLGVAHLSDDSGSRQRQIVDQRAAAEAHVPPPHHRHGSTAGASQPVSSDATTGHYLDNVIVWTAPAT